MTKTTDETEGWSLAQYPAKTTIIILLDDGSELRSSLVDPSESIAKVWPIQPGQANPNRYPALRSLSRIGCKAIQDEIIRPRVLPPEGDEGPVSWGRLVIGQEVVLQNESDGAGTMTYTGSPILSVTIDTTDREF